MTIVVSIAAITVLHTRHDATQALASVAQPSLVQASDAYAALSDADATASVAFLTGDLDLVYGRSRYISDLTRATTQLAAISRTAGATAAVQDSIFAINAQLPTYTGLVENARSNNRQGFPVGAAYLRRASETMRNRILPSVLSIYREEASKLEAAYDSGTSRTGPLFLLIVGAALVILMVGVQFWLARRTHRILNLGWLVATVAVVAVGILVGAIIASNSRNLKAARQHGSDPVAQLSSTRILAVRAQADESLALIARGSGATFSQDFDEVARRLTGNRNTGLAKQAQDTLRSLNRGESANILGTQLSLFFQEHQIVSGFENKGQYPDAIQRTSNVEAPHLTHVITVLDKEIQASQQGFTGSIKRASFDVTGMYLVVALGAVLICASIGAGIYPRLREYR
jgi:hypothetical protein